MLPWRHLTSLVFCKLRFECNQSQNFVAKSLIYNQFSASPGYPSLLFTCPFISNAVNISGPNRSKVTNPFTCISVNIIYCITWTLWKKIYIGETGRRLADRFREHLRDCERNDTDASKPVSRHFSLPSHSHHKMAIWGLSLHHGNAESVKNLERKSFNWIHFLHTGLMNASLSTNLFTNSCDHIFTNGKAPLHSHMNHNNPQFLYSFWWRANAQNVSFPNISQW